MFDKLIEQIQKAVPAEFKEHNGILFTNKNFTPLKVALAPTLETSTLQSITDYITENVDHNFDGSDAKSLFIHIVNEATVDLVQYLDKLNQRTVLVRATANISNLFRFGQQYEQMQFITLLQSNFVKDEDRDKLLNVVSILTAETSARMTDNGVEQVSVFETMPGINEKVKFKNPVSLKPFRTFAEVPQPSGDFVLRLHRQKDAVPTLSLHEADNGVWKNTALSFIKEHFKQAGIKIPILS